MKKLQEQINFAAKVVRNGFILSGLYFVSVWAGSELSYQALKPLIIFFLTYLFTEFARFYGLRKDTLPKSKKQRLNIAPMIY